MFDELIENINEKKINLTTNSGRNKLAKLINNVINSEGWDKSIKEVIKIFKTQDWNKFQIETILSYWQKVGDLDSIFVILTKYYLISKEDASWLFNKISLSDLEIILKKSIEIKDNQNYHILANNLINFYKEDLTGNEYLNLIDYVIDFQEKTQYDCKSIIDFFTFKKSQFIYAEVPDWVSIEDGENLSLLMTLNPGKNYEDVEHVVEKIAKKAKDFFYISDNENDIKNEGINVELEEALINYLNTSSVEESKDITHQANRIFGPANRFPDKNCISNPNKNGPCRMLECLCRELDDENDFTYALNEWFTGICNNYQCSKKIRDRSHCVRIPVQNGGWKGCFCSFDCLNNSLAFKDKDMAFRIEYMKVSFNEDGIMDRTKT